MESSLKDDDDEAAIYELITKQKYMPKEKKLPWQDWYKSRIVGLGALLVFLSGLWLLTEDAQIKEALIGLIGIALIYLRFDTTTRIKK